MLDIHYRIVGSEEDLKNIYETCQKIIESNEDDEHKGAPLNLLLFKLGVDYGNMPYSTIFCCDYSDGALIIQAEEGDSSPSGFGPWLSEEFGLTVDYWLEEEGNGFFSSDRDRLVRVVDDDKIVSNDEALDLYNRGLQEMSPDSNRYIFEKLHCDSDYFKNLHFDTIEDLQKWYYENEDVSDSIMWLQIAEYKGYEDWE